MRWLIDEALPPAVVDRFVELGHDARAVVASELQGCADAEVFAAAVAERRTIVTENFGDYLVVLQQAISAHADTTPIVFVRKAELPNTAAALAVALAERLDRWAKAHREPFPTAYWL